MIIRNPRKLVHLENLNTGAVFQKENNYYIMTSAYRRFSSTISPEKKDIACVNLENGHLVYFSINEDVYFCDAELVL